MTRTRHAPSKATTVTVLVTVLCALPAPGQECARGPLFVDGFESGDASRWGALPRSAPYQHVAPADVGVTVGVGVVGPVPTASYGGPTTITTPGAVIENVVIDSCLRIDADNVTVRNSIIDCGGLYPIRIDNGRRNVRIEHSRIACTSSSKLFYFPSGAPDGLIHANEGIGCQDFFFMQGDLDGLHIVDNVLRTLVGGAGAHADGMQIGQAGPATGTVVVRGNHIDPDNDEIGKTDIVFATNFSQVHLIVENNYLEPWGNYTLRCGGEATSCTVRHNVFSLDFASVEQHMLLANATLPALPAAFCCNRTADGQLVEEFIDGTVDLVLGADHVTAGCEPIAPRSTGGPGRR